MSDKSSHRITFNFETNIFNRFFVDCFVFKTTLSKFISEFFNFNSGCKLFSLMLISLSIILLTLLNAAAPEMQSY